MESYNVNIRDTYKDAVILELAWRASYQGVERRGGEITEKMLEVIEEAEQDAVKGMATALMHETLETPLSLSWSLREAKADGE